MYQVFQPKSEKLQKHIYNFAILDTNSVLQEVNYFAFPQRGSSMAFYQNATLEFQERSLHISKAKPNQYSAIILGKYLIPLHLNYKNLVPEVSINFTPTGLNYFFDKSFQEIAPENVQPLLDPEWIDMVKELFKPSSNEQQIQVLENFLLQCIKNKDLSIVEQSIALFQENIQLKVSEIANSLDVSTRTITRNFEKHVGCTPSQYKRVIRFRSAIQNRFKPNQQHNLTQLCLLSEFYDSPHFTKEFKKLTHISPRHFFKQVTPVGSHSYPYIFL